MSAISIERKEFGAVPGSGEMAYTYTFAAARKGVSEPIATISTYGAALLNFHCPSNSSQATTDSKDTPSSQLSSDVIVGYDTIEAFAAYPTRFFGVSVGRYCNRIAKGKFKLVQPAGASQAADSNTGASTVTEEYTLNCNNGPNHLHGGPTGYHHRNWAASIIPDAAALRAHMDQFRYFAASGTDKGPLASDAEASGTATNPSLLPAHIFPCVALSLYSPDGDEGYPGALSVGAIFSVSVCENETEEGGASGKNPIHRIRIDYLARLVPNPQEDKTEGLSTIVNLTNHAYFNLSAVEATSDGNTATLSDHSIVNHHLALNAPSFTPTDAVAIPTGLVQSVTDVPAMDFYHVVPGDASSKTYFSNTEDSTTGANQLHTPIGRRIGDAIDDTTIEQIKFGTGYDHNWCLAGTSATHPSVKNVKRYPYQLGAVLTDPSVSGRFLRVLTTQPGIQFYSGNFLDGTAVGKNGKHVQKRGGLCLETQHFPDSPNHPNFPSVVLGPSANYHHTTVFELGNL